jgi:hypothetical protein
MLIALVAAPHIRVLIVICIPLPIMGCRIETTEVAHVCSLL